MSLSPEKRKLDGVNRRLAFQHAYDYFLKLKNTVNERSEEVADPEGFMQDVDTILSFLRSNLEALCN